jgi:hypothetical protein
MQIGSDVIKVVPKVNNLGFVLNERLTAIDHFKKVCQKVYWILRSLRPHALKLGGGWLCHLLCLTLDMRLCWCGYCISAVHSFSEGASSCIPLGDKCYGRFAG